MPFDRPQRLMVGEGHGPAGDGGFRVGVGDPRCDLFGEQPLDRPVEPAAGRPVGVEERLGTAGRNEGLVETDDVLAVGAEVFFEGHRKTEGPVG